MIVYWFELCFDRIRIINTVAQKSNNNNTVGTCTEQTGFETKKVIFVVVNFKLNETVKWNQYTSRKCVPVPQNIRTYWWLLLNDNLRPTTGRLGTHTDPRKYWSADFLQCWGQYKSCTRTHQQQVPYHSSCCEQTFVENNTLLYLFLRTSHIKTIAQPLALLSDTCSIYLELW